MSGTDTSVTVSDVAYKGSSGSLNLPAGSYTIDVFAAGDTLAIASSSVDLTNVRQTAIVLGDVAGPSVLTLSD